MMIAAPAFSAVNSAHVQGLYANRLANNGEGEALKSPSLLLAVSLTKLFEAKSSSESNLGGILGGMSKISADALSSGQTQAQKEAQKEAKAEAKKYQKTRLKLLKEQFEIMKRVLANDPVRLAKYITNVTAEMRKILKDYAALNKDDKGPKTDGLTQVDGAATIGVLVKVQEMGASDNLDAPDLTQGEQGDASSNATKTDEIEADLKPDADSVIGTEKMPTTEGDYKIDVMGFIPMTPQMPEAKTEAKSEAMTPEQVAEAKSDIAFGGDMRTFIKKMKEAFEEAKIKGFFNDQDPKEKAKAYDELAKGFSALEKDIDGFVGDLEKTLPIPGVS